MSMLFLGIDGGPALLIYLRNLVCKVIHTNSAVSQLTKYTLVKTTFTQLMVSRIWPIVSIWLRPVNSERER